ncbi:alpha/beta hydrolase [Tundrisphaera sp. TA3]|uniref:alpha/beta hydrolase n=1 Tax=Tundrisphaera sp. TA3 TaxID=3435775 RepID=UPI003EB9C9E7
MDRPSLPRNRGRRPRMVAALATAFALMGTGQSSRGAEPAILAPAAEVQSYPHKAVRRTVMGEGPRSYWLFEPAEPAPEKAPVVVFNHGWFAVNPGVYGAWIEHLARSGKIVIAPRYQRDWSTPPKHFLPNALIAVRDALDVLSTSPSHVRPDRHRFAIIGHSAGGNLAAQMAAVSDEADLPRPKAVIAVLPGEVLPSRHPDLARIHESTLLVVLAAQQDVVVGDEKAREIFAATTAIPKERKKFVLYRTDLRGYPHFRADHAAPTAARTEYDTGDGLLNGTQMATAELNALDRAGFWRIADLTIDAAFAGRTLDEATDQGNLFRQLGYWSDGRPVLPPIVGDDLALIPRVMVPNGLKLISWPRRTVDTAVVKAEGVERR